MNTLSENKLLILCSRLKLDLNIQNKINCLVNKNLDWDLVLFNAKEQRIVPLLYHHLSQLDILEKVPSNVSSELRRISFGVLGRNITIYDELKNLLKLFRQAGIEVVILKGAAYIETLYKNIGLRPMSDIDMLFRESQLKKVRTILLQHGYTQNDRWFEQLKVHAHHLVHFIDHNKNIVEVHWSIGMYDQLFNIKMEEVWGRTKTINIEHEKMSVLSPEDMVLHQCGHIFIQHCGKISLINLCDLSETIKQNNSLDWHLILKNSLQYKLGNLIYCGLYLVHKILETDIPPFIFENLKSTCSNNQLSIINKIISSDFIYLESLKVKHPLKRIYWFKGILNKIKYLVYTIFPPKDILAKRY